MRQIVVRVVLILLVCLVAAGIDGSMRGFTMPETKFESIIPPSTTKAPPADVTEATPATQSDQAPEAVEEAVPGTASATPATPGTATSDDGLGMTAQDLKTRLDEGSVAVVDARPRDQFEQGHIPNAFSVPYEDFLAGKTPSVLTFLPLEQTLVIYCGGGNCDASRNVASMLKQHGYESVYLFERGFPAWGEAGFEVQTGPPLFE